MTPLNVSHKQQAAVGIHSITAIRSWHCTMIREEIKDTTCCLYNVYTVVTTSHGISSLALAVLARQLNHSCSYITGEYKVLVYIVQAT